MRMVFVGRHLSFDIPLATLKQETFSQPIFGANALSGTSPPLHDDTNASMKWKATFNDGVGTFLHIFYSVLKCMRRKNAALLSIDQAEVAYVDPNDPTRLFLTE